MYQSPFILWSYTVDAVRGHHQRQPLCKQVGGLQCSALSEAEEGISSAQVLFGSLLWETLKSSNCRVETRTQDPFPRKTPLISSCMKLGKSCVSLPYTSPTPPLPSAVHSPGSQSMWLTKANLNHCPNHVIQA